LTQWYTRRLDQLGSTLLPDHAAGSPPLDQGAKTPITIVTNWEATLKR
jgi:hypothetical protein